MANWIDRVVESVAPQAALRRDTARRTLDLRRVLMPQNYADDGASNRKSSLQGFNPTALGPDEDICDNLDVLRPRCRSLFMGSPVANGGLKTLRASIIGTGLWPDPIIDGAFLGLTDDECSDVKEEIKREFRPWAESTACDAARMQNFCQMQALALMSHDMSGDVFVSLPLICRSDSDYRLRILLIEADRICNPLLMPAFDESVLREGVETGEYGEAVAYHVARYHPGSRHAKINTWQRVEAFGRKTGRRNMLHIMNFERPGQRRGVPLLAPVIELLKQITRYSQAEVAAAVINAYFTIAIKHERADGLLGSIPDDQKVAANDPTAFEMGHGNVVELNEGEDVKAIASERPSTNFDGFVSSIARMIGPALELPYELLMKHFTASYSASRGALLEAWKSFKMRRSWFAAQFCQPIYEEWLIEAVAMGRVKAPNFFASRAAMAAYSRAAWNGDSQGQLDPIKEVKAAQMRVENCFSTRTRETAELTGEDHGAVVIERAKEERLMREYGLTAPQMAQLPADDHQEPDGDDESERRSSDGGDRE